MPTYDLNGHPTSAETGSFGYDAENRLAHGPGGAELGYDTLGQLFFTYSSATGVSLLASSGGNIGAEFDGSLAIRRRYVHGPDGEPLVWYEGTGTSDRRWYHADERGSIVAVSNGSGAAAGLNAYDEYGIPGSGNTGRFQYTGQQWLPELGMYHYRARAYSPSLGRFMQTDPIGFAGGMNIYAYVGNDSVNGSDPTGLVNTNCTGSLICPVWQNGGYNGTYSVGLCGSCSGSSTIGTTGSAILPLPDTQITWTLVSTADNPGGRLTLGTGQTANLDGSETARLFFASYNVTSSWVAQGGTYISNVPRDADGYMLVGRGTISSGILVADQEHYFGFGHAYVRIRTHSVNLTNSNDPRQLIPNPFGSIVVRISACGDCRSSGSYSVPVVTLWNTVYDIRVSAMDSTLRVRATGNTPRDTDYSIWVTPH